VCELQSVVATAEDVGRRHGQVADQCGVRHVAEVGDAGDRQRVVDEHVGGGQVVVHDLGAHPEQLRCDPLLEAVEQNARVTQRTLSNQLGIALGLTNIYVKRLVRKGCIKVVNVKPNRIAYLLTPRGVAEKARLTYEFNSDTKAFGKVMQGFIETSNVNVVSEITELTGRCDAHA